MPIFEYRCLDCGSKFDVLIRSQSQSIEMITCEKCHSAQVKKLISAFGIGLSNNGSYYGGRGDTTSNSKCSKCSSSSCNTCH